MKEKNRVQGCRNQEKHRNTEKEDWGENEEWKGFSGKEGREKITVLHACIRKMSIPQHTEQSLMFAAV